ncbi:MAG: guanylate cyclase, partial [Bacteroidia bacterium]|nr:guanylate cyclase [Bacteroidia bacterium]
MLEARKLASIAFADIAGYTAMMQTDERNALRILDAFKEVLEHEMALHRGQIIQFFGDGCLLSFDSALDGLHAATSLQN